jgi:phospholipid-binding lipoprotein MlaA
MRRPRWCRAVCALPPLLLAALSPAGAEAGSGGSVEAGMSRPVAESAGSPDDPWEPMNRKIFAFNEGVDRWLLEPVAIGWDFVMPERVQTSVGNFFDHMLLPIRFANDVLQAKPAAAYETAWRAVINTTVGIGGLFDPASAWNVAKSDEDFGQTLGRWGTPSGPYLVLPLLGPSNPRDTLGAVADRLGYVASYFVVIYFSMGAATVDIVNDRAAALESIRAEREAAFDFYTAVRSAYLQFRENQVRDRADEPGDAEDEEDLYYLDEDEDDEE